VGVFDDGIESKLCAFAVLLWEDRLNAKDGKTEFARTKERKKFPCGNGGNYNGKQKRP
jgi:hypothetical protein